MTARVPRLLAGAFLLLAGLWCGAMSFFAAFGARIVLALSAPRHAGGAVNRALLDVLDLVSYGSAGLLLVLLLVADRAAPWVKLQRALALWLLLVAAVAAFASHVVITPEMGTMRDRMGTILDLVPAGDPLRREWGRLHAFSSVSLLIRILAAAGLFIVGFFEATDRREPPVFPASADLPPKS